MKKLKKCSCCDEHKPFSEFHKDKNKSDGITSRCKQCRKIPEETYYNEVKVKNKNPKPRHRSIVDYDFLQHIRLVYRWVLFDNPDLNRGRLDMLLYLYPQGAFHKNHFYEFQKTISIYQHKELNFFIDNGWIKLWRTHNSKRTALYNLTNKGKTLCREMHLYCTGEKDLPTNKKFTDDTQPRINDYFLRMMKKMNSKNAQ